MSVYLSPMQSHRASIELMKENKTTLVDAPSSMHLLSSELEQDLAHLKTLNCMEDKRDYKRDTLLPKWLPKVEKYLQDGHVYQNNIFVYCIVWLIDCGEFERGIELAIVAADQNQATPSNWSMKIPGFVCKHVFEWAELTSENGHSVEPYFSQVFELITSGKWRIYESDRAGWYQLAGLNLLRDESGTILRPSAIDDITKLEQVKELLSQASALYPKIGVKTMIGNIEARINALNK